MADRKDCMTCFNVSRSLREEPCLGCRGFNRWVSQNVHDEQEVKLEFRVNGVHAYPKKPDPVNSPAHYTVGIQPIDAIESWGLNFRLANVIKYVARSEHKGSRLEDLKKARWYLDREISKYESNL